MKIKNIWNHQLVNYVFASCTTWSLLFAAGVWYIKRHFANFFQSPHQQYDIWNIESGVWFPTEMIFSGASDQYHGQTSMIPESTSMAFWGIPNNYYQTKPPFRVTAAEVANRINGIKNPMISSTPWGCTSMRRQEFVDLSVASHTLHWRNIADLDITLKSMGQNIFMFHCYGRLPKVFSFDCGDISMVLASK